MAKHDLIVVVCYKKSTTHYQEVLFLVTTVTFLMNVCLQMFGFKWFVLYVSWSLNMLKVDGKT